MKFLIKLALLVTLLSGVAYPVMFYKSAVLMTIMVQGRSFTKTEGFGAEQSDKFQIFFNSEIFICEKCLLYGVDNPEHIFNKLKVGKTYRVKIAGWNNDYLRQKRVIVGILSE